MTAQIDFAKMQGLGNEFMVIDAMRQTVRVTPKLVRTWADREHGIGFDQLLMLEAGDEYSDCAVRIFNADGSEVGQCGNGLRCVALFAKQHGLSDKNVIRLALRERVVAAEVLDNNEVKVDMGKPIFEPREIPFRRDQKALSYTLNMGEQRLKVGAVSLGNPHAVIQVESAEDCPVAEIGAAIQADGIFPEGVNVGCMQVVADDEIKLRVFERGVGETAACGSGACAAVVIGRLWSLLGAVVRVQMRQGVMTVEWQGEREPVSLTGPAEFITQGTVTL